MEAKGRPSWGEWVGSEVAKALGEHYKGQIVAYVIFGLSGWAAAHLKGATVGEALVVGTVATLTAVSVPIAWHSSHRGRLLAGAILVVVAGVLAWYFLPVPTAISPAARGFAWLGILAGLVLVLACGVVLLRSRGVPTSPTESPAPAEPPAPNTSIAQPYATELPPAVASPAPPEPVLETKPTPPAPAARPTVSAPQGIAIGGDNFGTATVTNINQAPPVPHLSIESQEATQNGEVWTLEVVLRTDVKLQNTEIAVEFDARPESHVQFRFKNSNSGLMGMTRTDATHAFVTVSSPPWPPQWLLAVKVTSKQRIRALGANAAGMDPPTVQPPGPTIHQRSEGPNSPNIVGNDAKITYNVTKPQPRRLSTEQRSELLGVLQRFKETKVSLLTWPGGGMEVVNLHAQFLSLFKDAGWTITADLSALVEVSGTGMAIVVNSQDRHPPAAAALLLGL